MLHKKRVQKIDSYGCYGKNSRRAFLVLFSFLSAMKLFAVGPLALSSEWQYRHGDSPFDAGGHPVWGSEEWNAPGWVSVQSTRVPAGAPGERYLWLRVRLPQAVGNDPSLLVNSFGLNAEAYLDGTRIIQFGQMDRSLRSSLSSWLSELVPLGQGSAGKILSFRVAAGGGEDGINGRLVAGDRGDLITWILRNNIHSLILGALLVLLSLFPLSDFFMRTIGKGMSPAELKPIMLPFGLSALSMGVFIIARSTLAQIIFPAPLCWSLLEIVPLCLIPIWTALYFERLVTSGPFKIVRRLWQVQAAYSAVGFILTILGRASLSELYPPFLYMTAATTAILVVFAVFSAVRGSLEGGIFALGSLLAAAFIAWELLAYPPTSPFPRHVSDWGLFLFAFSLTVLFFYRGLRASHDMDELAHSSGDVIYRWRSRPVGGFEYINPAISSMVGYTPEECLRDPQLLFSACHPEDLSKMREVFSSGGASASRQVLRWQHRSGATVWTEHHTVPVKDGLNGLVIHGVARDVTERTRSEQVVRTHLHRLSALRAIDTAIAGSLDLSVTLSVLLDHVTDKLGVDAADILLLTEPTDTLEYAAGRGFRSLALRHTRLRLGDGFAGKAALQRRIVRVEDLRREAGGISRSPMIAEEDFVWYCATPLEAKGIVKGVLEIFHRSPLSPDGDWLEFLQALAGQAAIAIDNSALFHSLQQSNLELTRAYDATIEGWSRALDLRDRETEGHTRRVTQTTMRLARILDVADSELVHIYRGALLHDIGKMAIPDSILLKPGALSEDEWKIMRNHPVYAHEMLSSISFLQPAITIPYCHHEKWDGSGYPRGISGDRIPLAARLFAAVDVWDALTSDRPYRSAWPVEKTRRHIASLVGTHFDPRIVEAFFKLDLHGGGDGGDA